MKLPFQIPPNSIFFNGPVDNPSFVYPSGKILLADWECLGAKERILIAAIAREEWEYIAFLSPTQLKKTEALRNAAKCRILNITEKSVMEQVKEDILDTIEDLPKSVPEDTKPMVLGTYYEDDWIAAVEVVEDNSNIEWSNYKLRVLANLKESRLYATTVGEIFEVDQMKNCSFGGMWKLTIHPEGTTLDDLR